MREIHAGSNYVSADPAEAHFGPVPRGRGRAPRRLAGRSETVLPAVQAGGALSIAKLPDGAPSCAEGGESNGCSPGGRIDSKAECLLEWRVTPTPPRERTVLPPVRSSAPTASRRVMPTTGGVDHECVSASPSASTTATRGSPRVLRATSHRSSSAPPAPRAARLRRAPSAKPLAELIGPRFGRSRLRHWLAVRGRAHPTTARRRARSGFHSASAGTAPSRRAWSSSSSSRRHATGGETRHPRPECLPAS